MVILRIAGTSGVTYIRWGRLGCEDNGATLLYSGEFQTEGKMQQRLLVLAYEDLFSAVTPG